MAEPVMNNSVATNEFYDMQALVRFAHRQLEDACFLLLQVNDASAARAWLRQAPVTSAATTTSLPDRALQVAFTAEGLRALEMADSVINAFSNEFVAGIVSDDNRSRRLGDIGRNSPEHWDWGGGETPHVLLMLYARAGELETWVETIRNAEFDHAFALRTALHTVTRDTREPFGFADGISQPEIDWDEKLSTDLHHRDRYTNVLKTGEIVLGYPNEYGLYTARPLLEPDRTPGAEILPPAADDPDRHDLGRNGSYLVMRQLAQDVPGFWQFVHAAADNDAGERDRLAASMVGRERDGTPLADTAPANNAFTFDDDAFGHRCPIGAHIRRANPRTGDFPPGVTGWLTRLIRILGFGRRHPHDDLIASSRFHRLLRRGRAYGPRLAPEGAIKPNAPRADRGLHFVCLGANILRQFEFVQNAWIMSSRFGGLSAESDALLGNREPQTGGAATNRFTLPQDNGPARCIKDLPQFVTVCGGGYFFMPGLKALQFIGADPTTGTEQ